MPYAEDNWAAWYNSHEYLAYERYTGSLASLPCLQDWPAVAELVSSREVPPDSVVVPGHTGDVLAGGRSCRFPEVYSSRSVNIDRIQEALFQFHYSFWPEELRSDPFRSKLEYKLCGQLEHMIAQDAINSASVFETWDWENRQAKFIVNSVRAYEFHRLAWWLPLWDREYLDFWAAVPLEYRREKRWYNQFVNDSYENHTNSTLPQERTSIYFRMKNRLARFAFLRAMKRCLPSRRIDSDSVRRSHPLAWHGLIPEDQFRCLFTGKQQINSFLAAESLGITTIRPGGAEQIDESVSARTEIVAGLSRD